MSAKGHEKENVETQNTSTEDLNNPCAAEKTIITCPPKTTKTKSSITRLSGRSCTKKSIGRSTRSKLSIADFNAKCYDHKRAVKRTCGAGVKWQHGKYCRDDCGSGIVTKKFDFKPSRRIWCRTPLTLYQATIGELGRKILCREKIVPRDVRPAPPCNIGQYILPLCRGYYRKYDCLRSCEEQFAVCKNGVKQYRDCVQRYWEPCQSDWQKDKLNLCEYAPQNSFLALKLRRKNNDCDVPCW